jgi:uncharacterized protein
LSALTERQIVSLRAAVRDLYSSRPQDLAFHGWPHIEFVASKSGQFAHERGADAYLVEAAALVHDINHLVERNSEPGAGAQVRGQLLTQVGASNETIVQIEDIICTSHTATRGEHISLEASALSDADSLFKSLPTTALLLTRPYLEETGVSLRELAQKILSEQVPLLERGIYFYEASVAMRYQAWAKIGLTIWAQAVESLEDPDVVRLLGRMGVPGL